MRIRVACALLAFTASGCLIDFVDIPDPAFEVTRLDIGIDVTHLDVGQVLVAAALSLGDLDEGRERVAVDSTLTVLQHALRPTAGVDPSGVVLRWRDTVVVAQTGLDVITMGFPTVRGVTAPDAPHIMIRHKAEDSGATDGWEPAEDLVLITRQSMMVSDVPTRTLWLLTVGERRADGLLITLTRAATEGALPDTVRVPAEWLESATRDTVEATIGVRDIYELSGPEGEYTAAVFLSQEMSWVIPVKGR